MTLLETQRAMAQAIFRPLSACDRIDPATDAGFIKPNCRLTALERLEIYSRSYWSRVLDSLREDFPGLRFVLGQRAFDRMAHAWLTGNPSRSWTLRDLGSGLESWLLRNPGYAGPCPALALDMARLEWAHIEAFDGCERQPLSLGELSGVNADSTLTIQPYVSLMELQYPVDNLLLRVRTAEGQAIKDLAARRSVRDAVRRARSRPPARIFVSVDRVANVVRYRRLSPDEFFVLLEIRRGKALGDAVDAGARLGAPGPGEFENTIQNWFASWSRLGWLCVPHQPEESPG